MSTQTIGALAVAVEIVRTALDALEHALDQPQDVDTLHRSYGLVRDLERQLHQLTLKADRLAAFSRIGRR